MTDIVERLRLPRPDIDPLSSWSDIAEVDRQRREAADEIERLRKALREVLEDYERYGGTSWKEPLHDPDILRRAKEAIRHD